MRASAVRPIFWPYLLVSESDPGSSEAKTDSLTILTPNKEASLRIKLEPIPKPILEVLEGETRRDAMRCEAMCSDVM